MRAPAALYGRLQPGEERLLPLRPPAPPGSEPRVYSQPRGGVEVLSWEDDRVHVRNPTETPATYVLVVATPGILSAEAIIRTVVGEVRKYKNLKER